MSIWGKDVLKRPADLVFPDRRPAIRRGRCIAPPAGCGRQIEGGFRDGRSLREYEISGLCQQCQDEFFGGNAA